MSDSESMLQAAEEVVAILKKHRVDAVVIGAAALAAYEYVRHTEDLDLGISTETGELRAITDTLLRAGYTAELREPDPADPLGGLIDVTGPFGLVQIVNFGDRFPAVIEDALESSTLYVREDSPLRIVPVPQLIALKLYAGGHKSKSDIVELLQRNPGIDLDKVRSVCRRYRLEGVEELIAEAGR